VACRIRLFLGIVDGARIFQFGSIHNAWDNLVVARSGMSNSLVFTIRNGWNVCAGDCVDCIVQDNWQTLVAQYDPTTSSLIIRMGDKTQSVTCWSPRTDRTFPNTFIGRNPVSESGEMLGKMAGFYAVDKFLSRQEVSVVINDIYLNNDLFDTWCGHDCEPGHSIDILSMTCELCPIGLLDTGSVTSGHYCNGCTIASTDQRLESPAFVCFCDGVSNLLRCSCAEGYTGDGSTCIAGSQCPHPNMFAFVKHNNIHGPAKTVCRCTGNSEDYEDYNDVTHLVYLTCRCNPGFTDLLLVENLPVATWVDGSVVVSKPIPECSKCESGKFNEWGGECFQCPPNSECSTCSANSFWQPTSLQCVCEMAFERNSAQECAMCPAGKFKVLAGNGACQWCGSNQYSLEQSRFCLLPPLNSVVKQDSSGFTCNTGYTLSDSLSDPCQFIPLTTCPAGKYLINGNCQDCSTNTFKNDDGPHGCVQCQDSSTSVTGSSECICNAGYSREDDDSCLACIPGKFAVESAQP